jgi:hypothetical protein
MLAIGRRILPARLVLAGVLLAVLTLWWPSAWPASRPSGIWDGDSHHASLRVAGSPTPSIESIRGQNVRPVTARTRGAFPVGIRAATSAAVRPAARSWVVPSPAASVHGRSSTMLFRVRAPPIAIA